MSKATRRTFILASLGFLGGCASRQAQVALPDVPWDESRNRHASNTPTTLDEPDLTPSVTDGAAATETTMSGVFGRRRWATGQPIPTRMDRMTNIHRITVHHDGMTPDWATSERDCAARIDLIRRAHQNQGWGDIGYHYVIDRSGRVWEARPLVFQGAHVRDHNPGNIGVLCTGNFEQQQPSRAQVDSLVAHLRRLMQSHRVPASRVYTHQELGPTACPGRALQSYMATVRRRGLLG